MEKQEALELLGNAMGVLVTNSEIEAKIAEVEGISREELDKKHENGEEMPECIKNFRKLDVQRKIFEENLIKHELREKGELVTKPALNVVFSNYPQFQQDYEILKSNGYIAETEIGLKWVKTVQSLAEYFGNLPLNRNRKNRSWKDIELLFDVKNLKNSFSENGNSYGKNQSKDYVKLKKLLHRNTPKSK